MMAIKHASEEEASPLLIQTLEDLNSFTEKHILDAEIEILRNKLRFLHQILPKGEDKKRVRGTLIYLKRWNREKSWVRITTTVMKLMDKYDIEDLDAKRIICETRFVRPSTVLAVLSSPGNDEIGGMAKLGFETKRKPRRMMKLEP